MSRIITVILALMLAFAVPQFAHAQSAGDGFSADGIMQVSVIENLSSSETRFRYSLALDSLHSVPLYLIALPENVASRSRIHVEGQWQETPSGLMVVPREMTLLAYGDIGILSDFTPAFGSRKIVAIRVGFNNATVACNEANIISRLWTGTLNVRGFYETNSYNQLTFPADSDGNSSPDIYSVSINYSTTTCQEQIWKSAANTALTGMGVNLNQYNHRVYYFPEEAADSCGYAGLAELDCGSGANCTVITNYCQLEDIVVHELGHNFGLNHAAIDLNNNGSIDAGTLSQYGDYSCPMGISGVGWRRFNAPHQIELGWIPDERVQTITSSGDYYVASSDIDPIAVSPTPPSNVQALKIAIPNVSGQEYYISYRRADSGYSQDLDGDYSGKTNIHRFELEDYTLFVDALADNESKSLETSISVTQLQSSQNWAQVRVVMNGTVPPTATPTAIPTTAPTATATPEAPPATPTATAVSKYSISGTVKVIGTVKGILRKFRISVQKSGSTATFATLSSSGKFSASLEAGKYTFRIKPKAGVKTPKGFLYTSKTATVSKNAAIALKITRR